MLFVLPLIGGIVEGMAGIDVGLGGRIEVLIMLLLTSPDVLLEFIVAIEVPLEGLLLQLTSEGQLEEFVLTLKLLFGTWLEELLLLLKEFSIPVAEDLIVLDEVLGANPKDDGGEGDLDRRDRVDEEGARDPVVEPNRRFKLLLLLLT
jgi:hypothetical protein